MLERITVDNMLKWEPCDAGPGGLYSRPNLERLAHRFFGGRGWATPLEVARCEHLSAEERLWVLLRPEIIPAAPLGLLNDEDNKYLLNTSKVARAAAKKIGNHAVGSDAWNTAWNIAWNNARNADRHRLLDRVIEALEKLETADDR